MGRAFWAREQPVRLSPGQGRWGCPGTGCRVGSDGTGGGLMTPKCRSTFPSLCAEPLPGRDAEERVPEERVLARSLLQGSLRSGDPCSGLSVCLCVGGLSQAVCTFTAPPAPALQRAVEREGSCP